MGVTSTRTEVLVLLQISHTWRTLTARSSTDREINWLLLRYNECGEFSRPKYALSIPRERVRGDNIGVEILIHQAGLCIVQGNYAVDNSRRMSCNRKGNMSAPRLDLPFSQFVPAAGYSCHAVLFCSHTNQSPKQAIFARTFYNLGRHSIVNSHASWLWIFANGS